MKEQSKLYIKDEEILNVIDNLDSEDGMKDAIRTLLIVTADTRRFLRQVYKELPKSKVFTQPTGNKEDIIVGTTPGVSEYTFIKQNLCKG